MARLTDDQLNFVISLDAQGAQGEINTLQSGIRELEKENKNLSGSIRETEKELDSMEKQMRKMEQTGNQNSTAYQNLRQRYDETSAACQGLRNQLRQNEQTISANQKQVKTLTDGLKLNEMSMHQLRDRASQLKKQLDVTSASANPKQYKLLQKELSATNNAMTSLRSKGDTLGKTLGNIPGPVGNAIKGVQGLGKAFKALIANPVGLAISAVVVAFKALKEIIAGSDAATTKLNAVMAALGSVLDTVKRTATEAGHGIYALLTGNIQGMKEHFAAAGAIASGWRDVAQAAYDASIAEDALQDSINRNNDIMAVNAARIEQLRQVSQDTTKDAKTRTAAFNELMKLQSDNYRMTVDNITGSYDVWKGSNAAVVEAFRNANGAAYDEVERLMNKIRQGGELTFEEEKRLVNAANDIARDTDKATEEQKAQYRQFFTDILGAERTYFQASRRDRRQFNSMIRQDEQQQLTESKKNMQSDMDAARRLTEDEQLELLRRYEKGTLTREKYDEEVRKSSEKGAEELLRIAREYNLDVDKYETKVLQNRIKNRQDAHKQQLAEAKKAHDLGLKAAKDAYDHDLAQLEERHQLGLVSDTEYQRRRQDLEQTYAQNRLAIEQTYAEQVRNEEASVVEAAQHAVEEAEQALNDGMRRRLTEAQRYTSELRDILAETASAMGDTLGGQLSANLASAMDSILLFQKQAQAAGEDTGKAVGAAVQMVGAVSTQMLSAASAVTQQLFEAETSALEAETQKQLTIAGDNADERERIEQEYAEKALELKKRQADADAALQSAQLWVNTATGIASAWSSSMAYGPAGPAIASALTALLMTMAGIQQAAIVAQRDAIRNQTLTSGTSSSGSATTGATYTIRPEYQESSSRGYADGGYTGDGGVLQPAGTVHRGEYVVSQAEMRNPAVIPMVRAIEGERQRRHAHGGAIHASGYADGGFTPSAGQPMPDTDLLQQISRTVESIRRRMEDPVPAQVNYRELRDVDRRMTALQQKATL